MKKRGLVILSVVVLLGAWLMVVGYEFLEKENARFQKNVKAAKEDQQRCAARNSKYRNYDQFRTSIRLPYTSRSCRWSAGCGSTTRCVRA